MMRAFDDFLIDRIFQPAVNWCGRMFGWTQWGIAKQANYAALAVSIIIGGRRLLNDAPLSSVAISLGASMLWFILVQGIWSKFKSTKDGSSRFRAAFPLLRGLMATAVIVLIPVGCALLGTEKLGLTDLQLTVEVICLYAMACSDPPPKEVRQDRLATAGAG